MSLLQMSRAWDAPVNLPQKISLLKIADECGDNGVLKIDQQACAKACGLTETEFMQVMIYLDAHDLLRVTARTSGPAGHVIAHGQLTLNPAALSAQKND